MPQARTLSTYLERGGLDFPGDDEPGLIDFAYFAMAVGTTFGSTDVTVTIVTTYIASS